MERRNFLHQTGMLAALGLGFPSFLQANNTNLQHSGGVISPVLLPPLPPLEHGGNMGVRVWMRNSMTNGIFSSVECAVAPKTMGPPPHHHLELDELMYVASGTAHVLVGDDIVEVKAGGWHLRPRNISHTFWNAGNEDLRFYDMYFNQPFEEYLEQIFFELNDAHGYAEGSEKKRKAIDELNQKFGVIFTAESFDKRNEIVKQFGLKG